MGQAHLACGGVTPVVYWYAFVVSVKGTPGVYWYAFAVLVKGTPGVYWYAFVV